MGTINDFFCLSEGSQEWVSNVKNSEKFKQYKKLLLQEMKGFQFPAFDELLIRELAHALDIEMSDVLVRAWRKTREIAQYRDTKKYPPGECHLVPLVEHTLVSKHHPTIQPVINHVPMKKFEFEVTLKLKLKTAVLSIRDGKIMEIQVGSCSGSGAIKYEDFTILEKKTASYSFPGSISLGEGILI